MELNKIYAEAELSEASYADFTPALNPDGSYDSGDVETALLSIPNTPFSQVQAEEFVSRWKVAHHQSDTESGFSATIFESIENPGTYTLSIRGTAGLFDIGAADLLGIASLGYARDQIYSLYNYFLRLITPSAQTVGQWVDTGNTGLVDGDIVSLYDYQGDVVDGLGMIVDASGENVNFDAIVDVTGHSLGGHLALAFSRLFPDWVNDVYTYNAPGLGESVAVDNFFSSFGGSGDYPSNLSQITTNIVGTAGLELISGFNGFPVSESLVFIEDQGLPSLTDPANHKISLLTDSLAVYNLLGGLNPSLTLAELTPILEAGSDQPAKSLENIVNALGDLLAVGTPITVTDDRDQLYDRIQSIQNGLPSQPAFGLTSLVALGATAINNAAKSADKGFLYALEHLNPFAVVGDNSLYTNLDPADFSDTYLADRSRLLKDKLSRAIQDDTASQDFGPSTDGPVHYIDRDSNYDVRILPGPPGLRIEFGSNKPGVAGDDSLAGAAGNDHLYGRAGDDILEGKGGEDYLEGGTGNDRYIFSLGEGADTIFDSDGIGSILIRSAAGDAILGGTIDSLPNQQNVYEDSDSNRYTLLGNDLQITLFDGSQLDVNSRITVKNYTDGMFGINLNPTAAPAAPQAPTDALLFELGQYSGNPVWGQAYAFSPIASGPSTHQIYGLTWEPGITGEYYLTENILAHGHSAAGPELLENGETAGLVVGGLGDSYIQGDANFNYLIDDLLYNQGSLVGTPAEWLIGDPVIQPFLEGGGYISLGERAGNDVMYGGGGNDWLMSHGGDDWLYGGDGNDLLVDNPNLDFGDARWLALPGASSDDHLSGGAGDDTLISMQGDDYLDGGDNNDVLMSGQGDDMLFGGAGNDWLLADAALNRHEFIVQPDRSWTQFAEAADETVEYGNDTLFGDAGDDILAGGAGDDWLMGGSENDTLWGDGTSTLDDTGALNVTVGDGTLSGNDNLFGEEGDDVLLGGGGDDYLDGGAGNDQLAGDHENLDIAYHGADHLVGGAGDDTLIGYGGNDALSGDAGDDLLWGDEGSDKLFGGDGVDMLSGGAGDDVASGGAGDDQLIGGGGDDALFGDAGADRFDGGDGNDVLSGGSGDDELYGAGGDDILEGGSGIDSLFGGAGDDVYVINPGGSQDVIVDTQGSNSVAFGAGAIPDSLTLQEIRANDGAYYLSIGYGSAGDQVFIKNGPLGAVSSFSFADGTVLSFAELMAQSGLPLNGNGSEGDDIIQGGNAVDLLLGGAGNDDMHGGDGADELIGGSGEDILNGDAGDDTLNGGVGNDELRGGSGRDSYLLHWGMGQDTLIEEGLEKSVLQLDTGISLSDLAMSRDGNDLVVQFKGISDGVRIKDYALSSQVWELRTDDGANTVIDDSLIDGAGAGVVDSAAAAIDRYETSVESIFVSTRGAQGSVAGPDGVMRRTYSRATKFGATTNFYNEAFTIVEQPGDAGVIARQSMADYDTTRLLINQETVSSTVLNVGVGQTSLDTSGGVFNPLTGAGTKLPSGSTVVNAFGRPQDLEGNLSFDTGDYTQPIGYWVFPDAVGGVQFQGLQFNSIQHNTYETNTLLTLERVIAGASDNDISTSGYSVVDAGAGNDSVAVSFSLQEFDIIRYEYNSPYDQRNLGSLLYGNTGNDELTGGSANDVLIGGEGDDFMDGVSGEDTYLVTANDTGWDIIADTGSMAEHPETFWTRYQDWYYQSLGINDWQEREQSGESLPPLPAVSINDYASIAQLVAESVIETDTVEFGAGISLSDLTVSWGEYVPHLDPEDTGKPGSYLGDRGWMDAGSAHTTMDISWADGSGIRVLMPHASPRNNGIDPGVISYAPDLDLERFDRFLGTGIEQFRFSDGTVLSMQDMLAIAPPPPTLDPHELDNVLEGTAMDDVLFGAKGDDVIRGGAGSDVYLFNPGDGVDTIEDTMLSGGLNSIRFGLGVVPSDLNILWTTDGLTIEVGAAGDAIILVNPDAENSDPSQVIDTLIFTIFEGFGGGIETVGIPLADLLPPPPADVPGEQVVGTSAYDTLVGTAGNDTIEGLAGNDTVFAGDGNDTIVGGTGRDDLNGESGDDLFLVDGTDRAWDTFIGGEGVDTILGGAGDDTIRLRRFDASHSVEVIDGGAGTNVIAGTRGYDTIDLSATTVINIDRIDAGAGNDTVTGNASDEIIVGGAGRDILNGGGGDDIFIVDGSDRAWDTFNGGEGMDTILGGAGDDTIRLRRFDASHNVEVIDGGAGTNVIAGTRGYDTIDLSATTVINIDRIDAGAGNDTVTGNASDEIIVGGAGRDVLNGGGGDDTFIVDGSDRAWDTFNGGEGVDTILGGAGDDTIRLRRFDASHSVEVIDGGAGTNVIAGTRGYDTIDLSATTVTNIDRIDAGAGNDTLTGTSDNDVIIGGAGSDVLNGGLGDDLYLFNRNDGRDRIVDVDTIPNNDVIRLGSSIRHDQLWFSQVGNDLRVEVIGTRDKAVIENWYVGSDHQIEKFQSGDGLTLLNPQVDQLVQAMAAFSAPASGKLDLSPELQSQLEPVLTANWQAG